MELHCIKCDNEMEIEAKMKVIDEHTIERDDLKLLNKHYKCPHCENEILTVELI